MHNTIPPGPSGGFLGLPLANRFKADPIGFLVQMHRDYGDVVHLRMGPIRFFLLFHPDLVREVLVTQGKSFTKARRQMRALETVDGQGLVVSDGELWQRQRRLVQQALRPARLEGYARLMASETERFLAAWKTEASLDLAAAITDLTLRIIGRTMFGVDMSERAESVRTAVHTLSEILTAEFGAALPLPDWAPLPSKKRKREALTVMNGLVESIIAERRGLAEPREDLLSILLTAVDEEGDRGRMSERLVRDEAMTMLNAGHDTTSSALAWAFYLIARDPEVEENLVAEIRAVLGDGPATLEKVAKLAYTERVVKETLRLYPPAYALFAREALEETRIGGFRVPKGSWIYLSPYVPQHDARFFPEPETFDPDRFAPGRAEAIPQYAYFPFGGGPHVCIGQQFAMMEMKLVLASILQRFRVRVLEPHRVEPEQLFSLRPKGGLPVEVRARA